jgi:hypothetical protein
MSPDIDNDTSYPLKTTPVGTDQYIIIDKTSGTLKKVAATNIHNGMTAASETVASVSRFSTTAETLTGTSQVLGVTPNGLRTGVVHKVRGPVSNPQAIYAQRAQLEVMRAEAAITITRIHIHGNDSTPTAEMALDLKFADDLFTGSFANATVIDICDTTSGAFTATSAFDDATVPSGKYIYLQFDSSPHADWKGFYFEMYYTVD